MRAVCRKAEISCSIKEKVDTQQKKQDVHEGWLTMWEKHCHARTGQKVINDSLFLKGGTGEAKVTVFPCLTPAHSLLSGKLLPI